jgi:hypothetical protein
MRSVSRAVFANGTLNPPQKTNTGKETKTGTHRGASSTMHRDSRRGSRFAGETRLERPASRRGAERGKCDQTRDQAAARGDDESGGGRSTW